MENLRFKTEGEPNQYFLVAEKRWLASIKLNGELSVEEQKRIMSIFASSLKLYNELKQLTKWVMSLTDWAGGSSLAPNVSEADQVFKEIEEGKLELKTQKDMDSWFKENK